MISAVVPLPNLSRTPILMFVAGSREGVMMHSWATRSPTPIRIRSPIRLAGKLASIAYRNPAMCWSAPAALGRMTAQPLDDKAEQKPRRERPK
jgi:hypothetical protein